MTAPGPEEFQAVWQVWNAKSAVERTHDAVIADTGFLRRLEELTDAEAEAWRLDLFGADRDLVDLLRMRLSEHVLHTWDIEVMANPSATLAADAIPWILDQLEGLVERASRPVQKPLAVSVVTTAPDRRLLLQLGDSATLTVAPTRSAEPAVGSLELPAEAFVRLVYGRLDPAHTPPSLTARGVELDTLRRVFPGV